MFGDITIAQVEYTIVYFDVTLMENQNGFGRYLMDSGVAQFNQFGGTPSPTTQADALLPLPVNDNYENSVIFYGISGIDCSRGASIAISAYPTFFDNKNINQFILNS